MHSQLTLNSKDDKKEARKKNQQWEPYVNNQGSVLGFIGNGYIMLAADTRISVGYSILSREAQKIFQLSDKIFIASSGMYADMIALVKNMKVRVELYKASNKFEPGVENIAQLLANTLYSKRFFPYYAFVLLAGINSKGELKMYGYDAVGSHESLNYAAQGSGKELIAPILDSLLKNQDNLPDVETGKRLALSAMNSCANRDIYTGDKMSLVTIFPDRIVTEEFDLRKD